MSSAGLGLGAGVYVLLKRTFNVIMFHIWKTSFFPKQQEVLSSVKCTETSDSLPGSWPNSGQGSMKVSIKKD